jgi:hypothetical protein
LHATTTTAAFSTTTTTITTTTIITKNTNHVASTTRAEDIGKISEKTVEEKVELNQNTLSIY